MSTEFLDALDEKGRQTGKALSKDALHKKELWHGVAHIWIYNKKGQMLLQLRHPGVLWAANKWDLAAGGHISATETPAQGAIREAREELGLDFKPRELTLVGVTTAINTTPGTGNKHKTHEWNYIAEREPNPKDLKLQADETKDAKWFALEQIEKDLNGPAAKNYSPRDKALYQLVIDKIRLATT